MELLETHSSNHKRVRKLLLGLLSRAVLQRLEDYANRDPQAVHKKMSGPCGPSPRGQKEKRKRVQTDVRREEEEDSGSEGGGPPRAWPLEGFIGQSVKDSNKKVTDSCNKFPKCMMTKAQRNILRMYLFLLFSVVRPLTMATKQLVQHQHLLSQSDFTNMSALYMQIQGLRVHSLTLL
jgi:hypothetical protein